MICRKNRGRKGLEISIMTYRTAFVIWMPEEAFYATIRATKSTPESLNHRSTQGREESKQPKRSKQKSQLISKTEKRKGRADYEKAETKQRKKSIEKGGAFTSSEDAKSHLLASIPASGLPLRQY